MRAWIVYEKEAALYNRHYIELYLAKAPEYGVEMELVYAENLVIENDGVKHIKRREELPRFAIVRCINPYLSKALELSGVCVFNSSKVSRICNHKSKTLLYVNKYRPYIPCVPTSFYENNRLKDIWDTLSENTVIKAVAGHGGSQVFCKSRDSFERIEKELRGEDFICQPFIQGPGQDVRVYVIGKEIIGAVRRQTKEGFRANYSLGGQISAMKLNATQTRMVSDILELFDFGMVGLDFIVKTDGTFVLNEIEDVVGARMFYQCYDIDLVDKYLNYITSLL